MTDILQSTLVRPPLCAFHTNQSIILPLQFLNNPMRLAKHTPEARVHSGAVGIVGYSFAVGGFWVEGLRHVGLGQLGKGTGFEAEEFEHGVEFGYVGCCEKRVVLVWGEGGS